MITSLILEWHNCSEHYVDDLSWSRIAVYRKRRLIVYEEFNGYGDVIRKQVEQYSKWYGDGLFNMLDKVNADMTQKHDYSVEVCDGSRWKLKIRHSNNKLQKIIGTVEYPPHGKPIEQELIEICNEVQIANPQLFGCSGICTAVTQKE